MERRRWGGTSPIGQNIEDWRRQVGAFAVCFGMIKSVHFFFFFFFFFCWDEIQWPTLKLFLPAHTVSGAGSLRTGGQRHNGCDSD